MQRKDSAVVQCQLNHICSLQETSFSKPKEPVVGHGNGAQAKFDQVARFHKVIWIFIGNICEGMMELMRSTEIGEWNEAWKKSNATPPKIARPCFRQMAMNAFMRHHCADKHEIGSYKDVE